MNKTLAAYIALGAMLTASCDNSSDNNETVRVPLTLTSEVVPMQGEDATRVSTDGGSFVPGDLMRLKIVTPNAEAKDNNIGEQTWEGSIDNYFLFRWTGSSWTTDLERKYDILGSGTNNSAPGAPFVTLQTPHVFTASTWSDCRGYKLRGGNWYVAYRNVFFADQSVESQYRNSDMLWAQVVMQTGTDQIHLRFHHVMACLSLSINSDEALAEQPSVTVEGMPDIDGLEILVGDRYAYCDTKYNQEFSASTYLNVKDTPEQNGKVIGVSTWSINNGQGKIEKQTIAQRGTNGVYTACRVGEGRYQFIVPPMEAVASAARIVVRSGGRKWVFPLKEVLGLSSIEADNRYNISLTLSKRN